MRQYQTNFSATAEKKEGKEDDDDDDDWETSLSATEDFFRQDSTENFDEIKEELIKACLEMQNKEDEGQQWHITSSIGTNFQ